MGIAKHIVALSRVAAKKNNAHRQLISRQAKVNEFSKNPWPQDPARKLLWKNPVQSHLWKYQ